ncbi:hypothetical protein HMPREF1531_01275 [Propionibacterium sp. oral taxon 192 str. F0372]|uniref:hypothetical protein n=1 Tax=Propionibacterium sp. oral taxon 192 TaxID=671222 RepID=UPI000353AB4A|nr:hypothetical protein [Propionibacterium sp. oral taxon 192]EPH03218.1 hypothetical protein HMPREF1531_01275 [Propionibacterium sp. oral taxon 192 str. F0372]
MDERIGNDVNHISAAPPMGDGATPPFTVDQPRVTQPTQALTGQWLGHAQFRKRSFRQLPIRSEELHNGQPILVPIALNRSAVVASLILSSEQRSNQVYADIATNRY